MATTDANPETLESEIEATRARAEQSPGVTCLDCHSNFHTNAAFHLTPDVRPQAAREAVNRAAAAIAETLTKRMICSLR